MDTKTSLSLLSDFGIIHLHVRKKTKQVEKATQRGLQRYFQWLNHRQSGILFARTPLCPHGIAYRRVYGLSISKLCAPVCGGVEKNL